MGFAFRQPCPRYSGTFNTTAPMAVNLWETFTFTYGPVLLVSHIHTVMIIIHFATDLGPGLQSFLTVKVTTT